MTKDKAALLIRVSTEDQEYINQKSELIEFVIRRGFEIDNNYIYEFKESAYHSQSKQYLKPILKDARLNKFTTVFIWSLDRLSRRGMHDTLDLIKQFSTYNIQVISMQEDWLETFTHNRLMRELMIGLIGFVAGFESQRKSERVQVAMDKLKREGKAVGRPKGSTDKRPRKRGGYFGNNNKVGA